MTTALNTPLTPRPAPAPEMLLHEGKLYEPVHHGLFTTYVETKAISVRNAEPKPRWRGKKMPFALWEQAVRFLLWTQDEHEEEAMLTFFYHKDNGWAVWPFAQRPNGMSVKLMPEHPTYAADRAQFGRGWMQLGSIHHHCTSSAFQSGTDKNDEMDREGIHWTIGNLDKPILDLHGRQVLGTLMTPAMAYQWIEEPEWLANVPIQYHAELFTKALLTVSRDDKNGFPVVWKERVIIWAAPEPQKNQTHQTSQTHLQMEYPPTGFTGTKWQTRSLKEVAKIVEELKITGLEAWKIFTKPRRELTAEDKVYLSGLHTELKKASIGVLFAEDLLRTLAVEERAKNLHEYGMGV